jgi:endonuclease/exonuclease/phosphatase family metal-dependent hydrolase
MTLRIATLNLEQNHKCWEQRRELIAAQLSELNPDIVALNEIHSPSQTGRWLQQAASSRMAAPYTLVQQSKVGADTACEAEGLLTRYPIVETASLDYRSHNCVALAARFAVGGRTLDVYGTHLIAARVDDAARRYQVGKLLDWVGSRADADAMVVCGDFNAAPDQPSIQLMAQSFRPTQSQATAFSPLCEPNGKPTHPEWPRFDRCIDYIWIKGAVAVKGSGLCFNRPAPDNPDLWPSDHVGVWADLEIGGK